MKGEEIMTPEELGKRMVSASDIHGGNTVEEAAKIFKKILEGEGTWAQNAVVLANAAMALTMHQQIFPAMMMLTRQQWKAWKAGKRMIV